MNKREEIQEGMGNIYCNNCSADCEWDKSDTFPTCFALAQFLDDAFNFLHSQGVVIKVERGLPKHIVQEFSCEYDNGYHEAQMDILKAGYVAVESLIK